MRFLFCLGCSSRHSKKYFSLTYFHSIIPIAQQYGWAAVLGRLSLSVYLCGVQKENNGKGKQIRLCKLFVNV
jgi:hypothetical protein